MTFRVHVRVIPRPGLLDPQGQAVEHALGSLGFSGVQQVRIGKAIELGIDAHPQDLCVTRVVSLVEQVKRRFFAPKRAVHKR